MADPVVSSSLNEWVKGHKTLVVGPAVYLLGSTWAANWTQSGSLKTFINWPWLTTALLALQTIVILVLLVMMPVPVTDEDHTPRASIAVEQFASAWQMLWLFWFLEFLLLTLWELAPLVGWRQVTPPGAAPTLADNVSKAALNLANNLPTLALTICYFVAAERTVTTVRGKPKAVPLPWNKGFAVLALITVVDFGVRVLSPDPSWKNVADGFELGSGLAAGLATALFVGRLDSKFIDLPVWAVVSLYAYAVIQPAWSEFGNHPALRATFLNVALVLKCMMFAVVYWLFKSGVFLFYVERVGQLFDDAQIERNEFLARVQSHLRVVRGGQERV